MVWTHNVLDAPCPRKHCARVAPFSVSMRRRQALYFYRAPEGTKEEQLLARRHGPGRNFMANGLLQLPNLQLFDLTSQAGLKVQVPSGPIRRFPPLETPPLNCPQLVGRIKPSGLKLFPHRLFNRKWQSG
ncbi:hypothetical protein HJG60_008729 [Phyllostomus discolor]|uniref:Uncharacterized protein n=1 Tax=Phyllostomus discolor TaxID=89673 RepID=A0A833YM33_9CHIR|nr:hypothetical protein HJG60_008729 [Phyllostomus discolor]